MIWNCTRLQSRNENCLLNRLVPEETDPDLALGHLSERVDCNKRTIDLHNMPVLKRVRVLFDNTKRARKRLCPFVGHQNEDRI